MGAALVLAAAGMLSLDLWDAPNSPASSSHDAAPVDAAAPAADDTADTSGAPHSLAKSRVEPRADAGAEPDPKALPEDSGKGRRVVFSQEAQRTWLVDARGRVLSTYLVSGSVQDNLDPGTYRVYSKSRWAVGVDDSGVMEYMVRFTHGPNGAAIGFHTIPTRLGVPLQTKAQLGTPQSHGCIRQKASDAIRLWQFAPIGTKVVVVSGD